MVTAPSRNRITVNWEIPLPDSWVFFENCQELRIELPFRGFDKSDMRDARTSQTKAAPAGLHVCPECSSPLVQPTCWEQAGERGQWRLWRRCPECEWRCDEVRGEAEIDAFDEELDLGTRALSETLKTLEQENMQYVVETFSAALDADLITADDFR
jgi:hypothetical protein